MLNNIRNVKKGAGIIISEIFKLWSSFMYFVLHITSLGEFPKPLSKQEEQECIEKMNKFADQKARKTLIEHNLRLVAHIIKKYYSIGYDQDDLISIGTIGLIKAVSSFDSSKGTRLATYAARCIENEVLMYFRNNRKTMHDVYMSDPIDVDKDGNALTLIDVISDNSDIIDDIDLKIKSEKLKKLINEVLTDREKIIIEHRYGINEKKELTQREVAKMLNISRSYVSRIEKKALGVLFEKFTNS